MLHFLDQSVFKSKVIKSLQQAYSGGTQSGDSDGVEQTGMSPPTQEQPAGSQRLQSGRERSTSEDEYGVRDIFKDHETFLRKQMKLAEQYLEKTQQFPAISSKHLVAQGPDSDDSGGVTKKLALEGKGPRTVPSCVKNRKRKLKRKKAKERVKSADSKI